MSKLNVQGDVVKPPAPHIRPVPPRLYEPNIIHNPRTWMGIWTPRGWRVHRKRFGHARRVSVTLSGDGKTTFFPHALLDPDTARIEWQDDLHLTDDPFTDGGIYPADPRVEYPGGQPRWAVSHTLLFYPVADHTLYTHEYTWDLEKGHLTTHFRRHVELEEARTDARNGMTVKVRNSPISTTIEGNVHYPLQNSAVRGVWGSPDKSGTNFYTRRVVQLVRMHNGVYAVAPHTPVVQCHGLWPVVDSDPLAETFDRETGICRDVEQLIERYRISIDQPRLGMFMPKHRKCFSNVYEGEIDVIDEVQRPVDSAMLDALRQRIGSRFRMGLAGYAEQQSFDGETVSGRGYTANFDFNNDGVIDEQDEQILQQHVGRTVRLNLYLHAYFGGDWLSTSWCLEPEHRPGVPIITDYTHGGGYEAEAGVIHLLQTPGPDQRVFVEYHHDAPADAGENNIRIHLYREQESA